MWIHYLSQFNTIILERDACTSTTSGTLLYKERIRKFSSHMWCFSYIRSRSITPNKYEWWRNTPFSRTNDKRHVASKYVEQRLFSVKCVAYIKWHPCLPACSRRRISFLNACIVYALRLAYQPHYNGNASALLFYVHCFWWNMMHTLQLHITYYRVSNG